MDENIKNSIDPIMERVRKTTVALDNIKDKDFTTIHDLEKKIRLEERTLELIENAISTFISHRDLSITLPIIFEHLYEEITGSKLPFLVVSREGEEVQTYPILRNEKDELLVGVIGIPLFSVFHTYEWILAGHELGHIIAAKKKLTDDIEYAELKNTDYSKDVKKKTIRNYEMEILADFIAMQIFGPVFLEVLLIEFTGAELGSEFVATFTHPPIPWRIRLCYDRATYFEDPGFNKKFEEKGAREFVATIFKDVIDKRYPMTKLEENKGYRELVEYKEMETHMRHLAKAVEKSFKEIRDDVRLINADK